MIWLILSLLTSPAGWALDFSGPDLVAGGYFVAGKPSAAGGEASLAAMFQPMPEHELLLGPSVSALVASADDGLTRFDLIWGLEATLWLVNAIGPGLELDVVAPSTITNQDAGVHFRVDPHVAIRLLRFGREGAWAIRLGAPYDTYYKWGFEAGITLQFSGVPRIGVD